MSSKIYYLGTCTTCKRIMGELPLEGVEKREIKTDPIRPEELDRMKELAGSYEALFSKKARNYRNLGLHLKNPDESEMRELILSDYTFLKRPVIIMGEKAFVGNSKQVVEEAKRALK